MTITATKTATRPPLIKQPDAAQVLRCIQQVTQEQAATWLEPVIAFARQLPACSGNILEWHFNRPQQPLDFAARLNVHFDNGLMRDPFAHYLPNVPPRLMQAIADKSGTFRYGIESAWMEYDAPFDGPPALFFDINRNRPFNARQVYRSLCRITDRYQHPPGRQLLSFLQSLKQLQLHIVYYGLMLSRNSPSLRLTVHGIRASRLSATLRQLGWQGNYTALGELQQTFLGDHQQLVVGLDMGDCIGNRIGIEVFDNNRHGFVHTLHQQGHISEAQGRLLHGWEKKIDLPPALQAGLTWLHRRPIYRVYTRINHFKFVIDDTDTVTTKGYLYYCF